MAAPFVFVRDWAELADALAAFGAADPAVLATRYAALDAYRAALEAHLRSSLLAAAPPETETAPTRCFETPLGDADRDALADAARAYYARGPGPTAWFFANVDAPTVPGATCTSAYATEMANADMGALCFDAACAPPNAKAFDCAAVPGGRDAA